MKSSNIALGARFAARVFFPGFRSSAAVRELLQGTGVLHRSGELASRSLLRVRNLDQPSAC